MGHSCFGEVWGEPYDRVIVCVHTDRTAPLALFGPGLPSILTLISSDLSNLALLHPIILITPTAALPHHLYTNGLSLLW